MGAVTLRRYTNLASTIHILRNQCLTLLNPEKWDDRNDAYFLARYKERVKAKTVLALCFARADETYHHWRVFAPGSDGVCIGFDEEALKSAVKKDSCLNSGDMNYRKIDELRVLDVANGDLPFLKRYPYRDEKEFRLLYVNKKASTEFHHLLVPLSAILRVTLSPWMPAPLAKDVRDVLLSIKGCEDMDIYRSTLINNERWKKAASPELDQELLEP